MSDKLLGFGAIAVSAVGFGSNFVPVKKFETGDGLFFQLIFCSAVFCMGTVVGFYMGFKDFYPTAMLGGALWATGNILCVPCIKLIGMALALCTWGATNMLMGWASGTFGLFGLQAEGSKEMTLATVLNYSGVLCSLVALTLYSSVRPSSPSDEKAGDFGVEGPKASEMINLRFDQDCAVDSGVQSPTSARSPRKPLDYVDVEAEKAKDGAPVEGVAAPAEVVDPDMLLPNTPQWIRRCVGIACGAIAGAFFGTSFNPPKYVKYHQKLGDDYDELNFVFAHFTGIFLTGLFWFLVYSGYMSYYKGQEPKLYPKVVIPAFCSGALWAIANIGWFVANDKLGLSVAFPIVTSTPNIVGSIWGVFVFKEVKGEANLTRLGVALVFTIACGVLIGLSSEV